MTRDEAMQQILDDRSLTPVDRNMLQVLILGADEAHHARYSVRALASVLGVHEKTARRSLESLEKRNYVAVIDNESGRSYRPFPFVRVKPEEANRHRIHFSLDEARVLYSDTLRREQELSVLVWDADKAKDVLRKRELTREVDIRIDIRGRFEDFFDQYGNPGIHIPEFYEEEVPRAK